MRYCRRCLFAFVLCLLLSIAFSIPANAEKLENGSYSITATISDSMYFVNKSFTFTPHNGEKEYYTDNVSVAPADENGYKFNMSFRLSNADNSAIIEKGGITEVNLEDAYVSLLKHTPKMTYFRSPSVMVLITYTNGTYDTISEISYQNNTGFSNLKFSFTPRENVKMITYHFTFNVPWEDETTSNFSYYLGEQSGDNMYHVTINQKSEEVGLLEGILGWIKNIWESVKNLPDKIWEKFGTILQQIKDTITAVINRISELPENIWNFFENGLQELFVPSDEFWNGYADIWVQLLAERFGGVYEVIGIAQDSWESIMVAEQTDTIEIPVTTIPLPDDCEFSFGGYQVKIIPDGFETIVEVVKILTGVVSTLLFVNGMRKKYDEVMGVEQ